MSIEPTNRIYEIPIIKKKGDEDSLPRKKPRSQKKEQKKNSGKIDIKV